MITIRQRRRRHYLEHSGFLLFEADDLCVIPGYVPYFKRLIRERQSELENWLRAGRTMAEWQLHIRAKYVDHKWGKEDAGGFKADPWKLLRAFEEDYRDRNPEYDSPWEKNKRRRLDFLAKIERTMTKQRGMA